MAFPGTGKIWMNGKLVDWKDATLHVASHVVHYGSAVFEGARCYATPKGSACFRLDAHMRRLQHSAKIYRMDYPLDLSGWTSAVLDTIRANEMKACYIRPIVYRGYETLGVNPFPNPVDAAIMLWDWGTYLGNDALENGVDVKVSSWSRMAPNTLPAMAKSAANYANSALIKMEAITDGYTEGIALDVFGNVSEGQRTEYLPGPRRRHHDTADRLVDSRRHHPRLHCDARPRSRLRRQRDEHSARGALHCGRGVRRRHRRRGDADSVDRQDPGRERPPRSDYRSAAARVLRRDQR